MLDENDSRHCIKVLRKAKGDNIQVLDGKGHIFTCKIEDANPKKCGLTILSTEKYAPPKRTIKIAIAPTKNAERIEWFVEKAVEIGVSEIYLFSSENSERSFQKIERLERIAISALKQSLHTYMPKIYAIQPLTSLLNQVAFQTNQKLIGHLTDEAKELSQMKIADEVLLLIGPEGDFSEMEVALAQKSGFQPVKLGESRLRTETAGLVGCTLLNLL